MRVLVVSNMYPTREAPQFGVYVKDQVEALQEIDGLEVTVWHFKPGGLAYLKAFRDLRSFARGKNFDVVHSHYGLAAWVATAVRCSAQVVTFHGTDLHHRVVGKMSRAISRSDKTISIASPSLKTVLGRASRRALVLPTGVDTRRFQPAPQKEARKKLGLVENRRYILFPSDPQRTVKRFDRAQAVVDRTPDTELLTLIDVAPEEVPLWINSSDLVITTSDYEGFGLTVVEALACNRPVLSTAVGIAPLVLEGLQSSFCSDFDVALFATKASELIDAAASEEGRGRAKLFDRRLMAKRVAVVYKSLSI